MSATKGTCPVCGGKFALRKDGAMRWHLGLERDQWGRKMCSGVGSRPAAESRPVETVEVGDVL